MSTLVIDDAIALLREFAVWCRWLDVNVIEDDASPERFAALTASPGLTSSLRAFAEDKSGSIYVYEPSDRSVRFFGSEGERSTVTADIADFVALVALGYTPAAFASGSRAPARSPNRAMLAVLETRYGRTVAPTGVEAIAARVRALPR